MTTRQRDENPAGIHLPLDPLPGHTSRGRLERVLRRGEFAVTTELNPPDSADPEDVYNRAKIFDGWVDAINAVDASGANCHMSSVGICALLTRMGYAPIMQIACRDKNRIAIQATCWAGRRWASPTLCLTGDGVQAGDQPGAKPVFDSIPCRCLRLAASCVTMASSCLAASSPRRRSCSWVRPSIRSRRPSTSARSISARRSPPARIRADAVLFRRAHVQNLHAEARDLGHTEKVFVLCGVGPLASAKTAKWIRNNVPGIHIPDTIIKRLEGARTRRRKASSSASTSITR